MIDGLIYAYLPCPLCSQRALPLRAWVQPSDFDEDGHSNGIEICELDCPECGMAEFETDEQEEAVNSVILELEDALWGDRMFETGKIYSYIPEICGEQT